MTNGEMIKIIFPNEEMYEQTPTMTYYGMIRFDTDWWNAEYKEPTTKNNLGVDCISRKSIKQKLQEHHDFFVDAYGGFSNLPLNDKSRVDEITNCIAMVVNEPPVTPQEPKTGKWISTETKGVRYAFWCRYKCSLCGGLSDRTNFCPNCGAKMVEPQESEDENGKID